MKLAAFKEPKTFQPLIRPGGASKATAIKSEFLFRVQQKALPDISVHEENFQGKNYLVFVRSFGLLDKAAFAFHISPFGNEDLTIAYRYFEYADSNRAKEQLKGLGKVAGNIALGFFGSGRSLSDETDLFRNMGQALTGGGSHVLAESKSQEALSLFQLILQVLDEVVNKHTGKSIT